MLLVLIEVVAKFVSRRSDNDDVESVEQGV